MEEFAKISEENEETMGDSLLYTGSSVQMHSITRNSSIDTWLANSTQQQSTNEKVIAHLLIRKTGDNTANRRPLCTDDVDAREEAGAVVVVRLSKRGALQDSG